MKVIHDLSVLKWHLTGFLPHQWRWEGLTKGKLNPFGEIAPVRANVPGSVQQALRHAKVIPDWNCGLNSRLCEWVEHRHWMFDTVIPRNMVKSGKTHRLRCLGLDGSGWIFVNGVQVGTFGNSFLPHVFDLTSALRHSDNRLQIIFDCPPRWLGQFGYTSQISPTKPRFYYGWDWMPRLVQIGIWDTVHMEVTDGVELDHIRCVTSFNTKTNKGQLTVWAIPYCADGCFVSLQLREGRRVVRTRNFSPDSLRKGVSLTDLPVDAWWPNGCGSQPLYMLTCYLLDARGRVHDRYARRVGFKSIEWRQCTRSPKGADPWLCVVNGKPVFLQGVNWTPIRPNFADLRSDDYQKRIRIYRNMGCNVLRVWGGAVLEREIFYDLCDEAGLLVWQEFPLSSAGIDNWPPEDAVTIKQMSLIAGSYIERRQHHASLLLWCGGNELQGGLDGDKQGIGRPVGMDHPLMRRIARLVVRMDPGRRFLPTSASGPRFMADPVEFGKGLHWDVHGPWSARGLLEDGWTQYWRNDDALFRSEVGAPGSSYASLIGEYAGGMSAIPGTISNPLWRRFYWWLEWHQFLAEKGHEPANIEEYVTWSQNRQKQALGIAVRCCKERFPSCGGVIIWMGHDAFPCQTNTSLVDFDGRPKPAVAAVRRVFRSSEKHLRSRK